jgi:MYXO-CTERM domain-containing protein
MNKFGLMSLCLLGGFLLPSVAHATKSAELYTSAPYTYGRFEARMRVTAGDGVVSAFFLWKDGSEQEGMFWNELDFEKIGANCTIQTNALYGNPEANHTTKPTVNGDLCAGFHVYGYEWTADYVAWFLDGTEVRRETGETAAAFAQNASAGMQVHFNIWPGDASFGGNFNPSILPVHQYVDWVQYSSYANGNFTLAWREDFGATTAPTGWLTGDWGSPKNLSTHDPLNVNFMSGCAILSMTADDATGPAGAMPDPSGCTMGTGTGGAGGAGNAGGAGGTSSNGGTAGTASPAGGASTAGAPSAGGSVGTAGDGPGTAGMSTAGTGAGGTDGGSGATGVGGAGGSAPVGGGTGGTGTGNPSAGTSSAGTTSSGTAGSPPTGTSGGAPSGGNPMGGNPASAGTGTTAGESGSDEPADEGGCGCRVPGATHSSLREAGIGVALLLALAGFFRRRRSALTDRVS